MESFVSGSYLCSDTQCRSMTSFLGQGYPVHLCATSTPAGLWSDAPFECHHNSNNKWTLCLCLSKQQARNLLYKDKCFPSATADFFHVFNLQWTFLIYLHSLHYHGNWARHSLHSTHPHHTTAKSGNTIILGVDTQITGSPSKPVALHSLLLPSTCDYTETSVQMATT